MSILPDEIVRPWGVLVVGHGSSAATVSLVGPHRTIDAVYARDVKAWMDGKLIQDAMPYLSAEDREYLITGMTPDDWRGMDGEESMEGDGNMLNAEDGEVARWLEYANRDMGGEDLAAENGPDEQWFMERTAAGGYLCPVCHESGIRCVMEHLGEYIPQGAGGQYGCPLHGTFCVMQDIMMVQRGAPDPDELSEWASGGR